MVTLLFLGGTYFCPLHRPRTGIVPRIFFCTALLLLHYKYYRAHIVGSCGVGRCFFSAVCCAALLLYYCCSTGWLGGSVRGLRVLFFFLPLYRPALASFSVPLLTVVSIKMHGHRYPTCGLGGACRQRFDGKVLPCAMRHIHG